MRVHLASAYRRGHRVPQGLRALEPHVVRLGPVEAAEHVVVPRAIHCRRQDFISGP